MESKILSLDSAFDFPSVSLFCREEATERRGTNKNGHVAEMNLLVRDICKDAGISYQELHAISLNIGPGSFTGLRVGTSIAKAMSMSLNIPILAHSSNEILKYHSDSKNVLTMIDARNNNIYHQNHGKNDDEVVWTSIDEALEENQGIVEILVNTESLFEMVSKKTKITTRLVDLSSIHQHAIANQKFEQEDFVSLELLAPKYVLRPKITKRKKALF